MMDGHVMFRMMFCSSGLLGNKQSSTKVASERRIMKVRFGGCHSYYWWNWLHISSVAIGLYHIVCILKFNSAAFQMDGSGSSWMMLQSHCHIDTHSCPQEPRSSNGMVIHPLHLYLMKYKHFSTLHVKHSSIIQLSCSWCPCKWMDATYWTWMLCIM